MAQQTINVGTAPNDGTGTPLRTAFQYTNSNFSELYTATGPSGNNINVPGSATITGDLTVDTSTLKVDSANNRVGIGTATPLNAAHIQGTGQATVTPTVTGDGSALSLIDSAGLANSGGMVAFGATVSNGNIGQVSIKSLLTNGSQNGTSDLAIFTRAATSDTTLAERFRISQGGICTWSNVGGVAGTAMTLNSTGLGVGGSPLASHLISSQGPIAILGTGSGTRTSYISNTNACSIYYTDGGGSGFFADFGNLIIQPRTSAGRSVVIATSAAAGTPVERLIVDPNGNVGIGVTPSAGKGCLQLSSGINFPATQVASSDANTLDDYVETTFSPTIVGSTVAGTATYTTQIGRATKIGRLVTFSIRVAYSAGTGIGNLRVGNLPFAAGSGSVFAVYAENIALTAGNYPVCGITSGNTFISIDQLPTGGGSATAVPYDAAGDIQISGSYIV